MLAAAISTQPWNDFQASSHEGCRERSVRLGEKDGVSSRYSCRGGLIPWDHFSKSKPNKQS